MTQFILGSASPRRRELLAQIGFTPDRIEAAHIDERLQKGESPGAYAARLAKEKSDALAARHPDAVILTADTVVAMGCRVLDKPGSSGEARQHLQRLSGRRHQVMTALCVRSTERSAQKLVRAQVKLKSLSGQDIDWYIASGEWEGKAGGYGIQGAAARFVPWINGSYTAIVGLPLTETAGLLASFGIYPVGLD